ncbi:T9SS sorting signal type C domain-containing protein [Winogradskyella sp.]|uniref:T9SS sorting signal type C domain-containing protein n=1 Tax=Winogradskyella sp. TaxID=1883156 RepID=UPI002604B749|nr:T9SS sorting signal type C domain-containing protein [Winogradskyella sp.]
MIKKTQLLLLLLASVIINVNAQVTIFAEDFEDATYPDQTDLASPNTTGWTNINFSGTDNRWWVLGGTSINAINGNHSLAVSQNVPYTGTGIKPEYNVNSAASNIAQSPLIDATGYIAVTLDFNWICEGEDVLGFAFDYGRIAYSFDGTNWFVYAQEYLSQSTTQSAVNLDISVVAGQQFYLGFVWENDGSFGTNPPFIVDDILIRGYLPPSNDECSGATVLTPGSPCVSTLSTTIGASQSQAGCTGAADDDVWFEFNATDTEQTIKVRPGNLNDVVFEVFSGSCGSLTSIACVDNTTTIDSEEITLTGLTVGSTYYVRVYSYFGSGDEGSFYICVTEPCSSGPGTGTSDFGCAAVDVMDSNANNAITLGCDDIGDTIDLEASFLELGNTDSYTSQEIAYNPPYQFGCLTNPVSINDDDVWSPVIDFSSNSFEFCFYGQPYNSCTMNSNGVISFDTSLATLYTGWEINNTLPNATSNSRDYIDISGTLFALDHFFGPSIFGVHHDIDPRAGGEIGWEFVDLTTSGSTCRALITAWHDVPMFADPTILYSGMIVLYENTNVIEVYIEEKNMDVFNVSYSDIWNFGNAQIGLQNATGTQAEVVRDITDGDWTMTNRAWRFTPSGASITSLRWLENGAHNPTYDDDATISVSPNSTTTYTAEVTYNLCNTSSITRTDDFVITVEQPKLWDGSQANDNWMDPLNWSDDTIPLPSDCIIIPNTGNDPVIYSTDDGDGLNLTIENGATLTQQSNSTLTIVNTVNVESGGTYNMLDSASLIQIDDVVNTVNGTFTMQRTSNIRQNDYVYWSSPSTSFNVENVSPLTPNGYKYEWIPTTFQGVGPPGNMVFGEWQSANTGAMDIGKGYIIRGPAGHPVTPTDYTATFSGTPNNGSIVQPIERGTHNTGTYFYQPFVGGDILTITDDDDNWNLLGNPYPSAINAISFLTHASNGNISGSVYLWTHGTDIGITNPDPFYEDFLYNYNVADYIAYNSSGTSSPSGFNGNIGAGQGFFVLMTDVATVNETVTFDNTMRNRSHSNDQFYRSATDSDETPNETNRIWLDYISPSGQTNTTLVAYVDGATNEEDRMFDAATTTGNGLNLYSIIDNKTYLIQGRQLPFNNNDQVPIGLNITESGIQTIGINALQGLFNDPNQDIYIEDLTMGLTHNLKDTPYSFTSELGYINDRFILRYTNNTLGVDNFNTLNRITVFEENEKIVVKSDYEMIQSIEVFDVIGRHLYSNISVNTNEFLITAIKPQHSALFLRIKLTDGKQKIAKIIF